jgi:hypothetical protein
MRGTTVARLLALGLLLGLGASAAAQEEGSPLRIYGSVKSEAGYIGLREELPDPAAIDWYSRCSAYASVSRRDETTRFLSSLWTQFDAASGEWQVSLDEAWGEWRPAPFLGLRLGRFPLQYGPCIAFNPANTLSDRNLFESRAGKVGLDGLSVQMRPLEAAGGEHSPFSVVIEAAFLLPGEGSGSIGSPYDIEESSAHGRISCYAPGAGILGPTEIGVSGDARRLGGLAPEGERPMAAGAWLSAEVGGFVLGAEGSLRTPGYASLSKAGSSAGAESGGQPEYGYALSLNRKLGDFFIVAEASYLSPEDEKLGFARLSWTPEDLELSLSALIDLDSLAARTAFGAGWAASDSMEIHADASWNYKPDEWSSELWTDYAAGLSLECFF